MHNQNNIALQIGVSQKVVHRLRAAEWEQLALEHGYFDQSRLFSSFEACERWTDESRSPMKHRYYRLASGASADDDIGHIEGRLY
jgi:hypothetical protein